MTKEKDKTVPPTLDAMGTRDAVETAIDMSKADKTSTWEGMIRSSKHITRWGVMEPRFFEDQ